MHMSALAMNIPQLKQVMQEIGIVSITLQNDHSMVTKHSPGLAIQILEWGGPMGQTRVQWGEGISA